MGINKRCFNVIDSVKGGSGKSSLSLMLALACSHKFSSSDEARNGKISAYLIDMDFQGSAFSHLIFGKSALGSNGQAEQYINEKILSYYRYSDKKYISNPIFKLDDDKPGISSDERIPEYYNIAASLASPYSNDRARFKAVSRLNYSLQITYSTFYAGLKKLISSIDLDFANDKSPEYILFDMPPNSNGYSDAVLDILFGNKEGRPKDSAFNYFELMTFDSGHIDATMRWLESFVKDEKYCFPDHFFFVFNNVPTSISNFSSTDDPLLNEIILRVQKRIVNIMKSAHSDLLERISLVGISYQADYLKKCCSGSAIIEDFLPTTIKNPVSFYVSIAEPPIITNSAATKWLLERMKESQA